MAVNASRVSAGAALDVLRSAWHAQQAQKMTASWMLHGRPGVGKTELVQSLANEFGAKLFDIRLTTIEPQDLRGLPYYDHESGQTVWYPPQDLPKGDAPSVLFLDELTAASPMLQPTIYGLLQERRIGQYKVPEQTFIVAAGNMVEDGAIAYDMGTALADRLVHIVVQADPQDWLKQYAPKFNIHPTVASFLNSRPDLFDTTEISLRRQDTVACTPRSWTRVSAIMSLPLDRATRQVMIAGTIGEAAAAEFTLIADEIQANVQLQELLSADRRDRAGLYPQTLHGLTALVYGMMGVADPGKIGLILEVLLDLRDLDRPTLPVAELATFGIELLIGRALENGWQAEVATSPAYRQYAAERADQGLP